MSKFFLEPTLPNKAPLSKRLLAFTIDVVTSFAIALLLNIFFAQAFFTDLNYTSNTHLGKSFINLIKTYHNISFTLSVTVGLVFIRDLFGGRSLGKKIMKLVIIHKSAQDNCRYSRTFLRSMVPFIGLLGFLLSLVSSEIMLIVVSSLLLADLVLISTQSNHRSLGDWLTDTVVIVERRTKDRPPKQ